MRQVLVTGSDTGAGKTQVVAALARLLATDGAQVQIVKVVETGRAANAVAEGDAERARLLSGAEVAAFTLATFPAPLAPPVAAALVGEEIIFDDLLNRLHALAPCDWRILEGAGGIATPLDAAGQDWADFARAVGVDAMIVVVPDRLGSINQARLAYGRAKQTGLHAGVWLNAASAVDTAVAESNRGSLIALGVPLWAEQAHGALAPCDAAAVRGHLLGEPISKVERVGPQSPACDSIPTGAWGATRATQTQANRGSAEKESDALATRAREFFAERESKGLRRVLRVTETASDTLNLADNDYLALARDPAVAKAVAAAVHEYGSSASASPLITGWHKPHARLVERLGAWHGFPGGLLWNSGYAANSAVLGVLPTKGDLVLADRLIHHSMIAGLLRSGARLRRYEHLNLDHLEAMLAAAQKSARAIFVVTESVFSMDGDFPDLTRMADIKRRHGFCWIVDEAHGLGWYGPEGAGLVRESGVEKDVDVLVGTLGKTLASGGAYTLFRHEAVRDYVVNTAGEFIYSTSLSPLNVASADAALSRVHELAPQQKEWQAASQNFRETLRRDGWVVPKGNSPIVPVRLDDSEAAVSLADTLREAGVFAAAIRPPTVPAGTSRLRFSLKRTFGAAEGQRVLNVMSRWRAAR